MLCYVDQLVAKFDCLAIGAGQVAYSWFIGAFSLKTAAAENNTVRVLLLTKTTSCGP